MNTVTVGGGSLDWWRNYANGAILQRVGEEKRHSEVVEWVARYCAAQNKRGYATCILHALAVYNVSTRCFCVACEKG